MYETPPQPHPSARGRSPSRPDTRKLDDVMRKSPTGPYESIRTPHPIHERGAYARAHETVADAADARESFKDIWTSSDLLTKVEPTHGEDAVRAYDSQAHAPRESFRPLASAERNSPEDTWKDLDQIAEELGIETPPPPYEVINHRPEGATEAILGEVPDLTGAIEAYRAEQEALAAERTAREARERRSALIAKARAMNFGSDEETERMRRRIDAIRRNLENL